MKYRWVFSEGGLMTECHPIVDDDAAIDFQQQTNEVFYRAKLNGSLAFRFEFDDIMAKGYNYEHIVVLQWYDEDNNTWSEVWKGRFALTDCEIDFDTKTISVQPETVDRYTQVLDHLEDEYNLLKIAPVQQPVSILIRPLLQVYALNDSSISNCIGGNSWIASCDTIGKNHIAGYHFTLKIERIAFVVNFNSGWTHGEQTVILLGEPSYDYDHVIDGIHRAFYVTGKYYDTFYDEYRDMQVLAGLTQYPDESVFGLRLQVDGQTGITITYTFERDEAGTAPAVSIYSGLTSVDDSNAQWDKIYARILMQTEDASWLGYPLYDLASNDMAGANLNYNKIAELAGIQNVLSSDTVPTPTEWGQAYTDMYFTRPTTGGKHWNPVGQGLWKYISWWYEDEMPQSAYNNVTAQRIIKDAYKVPSILLRLFQKTGMAPQGLISRVLNGNNDYVGEPFFLCMTPKSNVISSYYDTPAQNAPITLQKMLSMLKQAYKIYWHIDENGYIHFEHISYYDNGQSYTETTPALLLDLESQLHTNTKNNKVFGQNKIKFDKADMPELFIFGWADSQTKPFDGWQIKGLDAYVSKGQNEEKIIGDFDTDIDFVLSSPNDVSKEGFFLFACPVSGGVIHYGMNVQKFTITDEAGEEYDISIQNADGAFFKIHNSFWRYQLPCENVNINNKNTTAITTGRFKVQSVEFADVVMADILKNVDECMKVLRTQQGDGHIKNLSINLNSLKAKGDLVFNFIGRWYYLRGTALGASITITINGEQVEIDVENNSFVYRYNEPITSLTFDAADVVSVDFADTDRLEGLTSADNMFDGCEELVAVDFDGKDFAAVVSADYMFRGCAALTTLICPDNSTWKPDLDFSDCPLLTADSLYDLIGFLYLYNSGTHTITPNTTMWQALDSVVQDDIIAKANAKGWNIAIPAQYSITGQSAASTVYATINGVAVEIPVTAGAWHYDYNTAITSFSFEADADVTDIDFSLSDGLAGVTSLNDAFKDCSGLTSVDFTNCDLSNVASAADAFANCSALYELIIPQDTWKPDIDLSASVMPKTEMLNVINGLYIYTSGTHTITFNSTIWDAMPVADQQIVFDAADAKGWTTNAVAVVYYIRGTSSNVNGTETFNIQFIQDGALSPDAAETITCNVDANGDWEYSYVHKKVYSLSAFIYAGDIQNNTMTSCSFTEGMSRCVSMQSAFYKSLIQSVDFSVATFDALTNVSFCFYDCSLLTSVDFSVATFDALTNADSMFDIIAVSSLSLPNATFASVINAHVMFGNNPNLTSVSLPNATFASATNVRGMFGANVKLASLSLPSATFDSAQDALGFVEGNTLMTSVSLPNATFASLLYADRMFKDTPILQTLNIPNADFSNLIRMGVIATDSGMFEGCGLTTLDLSGQTFASVQIATAAFAAMPNCTTLKLPNATFANLQDAQVMFIGFTSNTPMLEIDLSSATFASCTNSKRIFERLQRLTTLKLPTNSTAIAQSATPTNTPIYIGNSPLTYQSMLNAANWVRSFVGYSAHTITFKATAWNALSTAEQNNIDSILSGKNWTRAIA